MAGPNSAPSTAPPTNPMKLSEPTMKPCRYPETANAAATTIRARSSRSPRTNSTVSGVAGYRSAIAALAHRVYGRLGPVLHPELGENRAHVRFHRFFRQPQQAGDLPVRPAFGDLREHLALSRGQRVGAGTADKRPEGLRGKQHVAIAHRTDGADQRVRVDVLVEH